ncbi:MAG: TIGR03943 family protein [Anaerolineae bacterium]|nr:TIGR03943 family protein [Anaerolineae bacterium]
METTDPQSRSTANPAIDWVRVQAWVQTGILYLTGLYLVDLMLPGGQLAIYVNVENLGWLTWVGAALLFAMALGSTFELMNPRPSAFPIVIDPDYGTAQQRSRLLWNWVFLGIVTIPLVLGLGVPARPLSSQAITTELSADVTSLGLGSSSIPSSEIAPEDRNLLDWLRTFAAAPDLYEFEGQPIEVVGFMYRDARFRGTERFMVVRFTLSCCVADARPIGLVVDSPLGVNFEDDTWVRVRGTVAVQMVDGIETPIIIAESLEPTEQPEQPYLYF